MRNLAAIFLACFLGVNLRAAEPFNQGRIVIVSGLPGDVESDGAYQRRWQGLLDFLAENGVQPGAVHLLVHEPERAEIPEAWKGAEVRAATRANFLALGERLGKSAAPVSVLVWGHGGQVRNEPVLHVAGPRITGADFRDFAEALERSGSSTRWVLFFTGSGEVAREIAAPSREILASENSVRFTSDPRGLDLVLEAWKKDPGATLETLARAAGPRIAGWYASRQQARTEEPVFLSGGEEPVLLAEIPPARSETAEQKRPESWKSIQPVNPASHPGAGAVMLRRSVRYTLGENPAVEAEIEEYTQILTTEGKTRGDFEIAFSPPQEDVEFTALEVLGPDGKLEVFDREDVLEGKAEGVEGYETGGQKVFSLPGVKPGAILHVHYRRIWRRFPFPHVFLELPLSENIPVLHCEIEVEVPRDTAFHYHFVNLARQEARENKTAYGRVYQWSWKDLAPFKTQFLASPDGAPRLQISTFPDWKTFADWYQRLIREADTITDEIRTKTAEITSGMEKPEDKVKALYEFVTGMRYVAIPLGVNSYRPHAAAGVLRNHYGDCKDKANLLNAMLRVAGFKASLVLVPRFTQADEKVPGLAFNHAISRVELPSGPLWLDPTDDVCPFGLLPPGDAGRNVLVVDGSTHHLQRLPEPEADRHGVKLEFQIEAEGKNEGEVTVSAKGYPAYFLRAAARISDDSEGTFPLFSAAGLKPVNGTFLATTQIHTPVGALEKDFSWQAKGRWTGLFVPAPGGSGRLFSPPFVIPAEWQHALQDRSQPLFLNNGYPVTLRQVLRIRLASNAVPATFPPEQKSGEGPLQWRVSWKREGALIMGEFYLALQNPQIGQDQVPLFQQELTRLYTALETPLGIGNQ